MITVSLKPSGNSLNLMAIIISILQMGKLVQNMHILFHKAGTKAERFCHKIE